MTKLTRTYRCPLQPDMQHSASVEIDDSGSVWLSMSTNGHEARRCIGKGLRGLMFAVVNGLMEHERNLTDMDPEVANDDGELLRVLHDGFDLIYEGRRPRRPG
jgi:hypothetical protein